MARTIHTTAVEVGIRTLDPIAGRVQNTNMPQQSRIGGFSPPIGIAPPQIDIIQPPVGMIPPSVPISSPSRVPWTPIAVGVLAVGVVAGLTYGIEPLAVGYNMVKSKLKNLLGSKTSGIKSERLGEKVSESRKESNDKPDNKKDNNNEKEADKKEDKKVDKEEDKKEDKEEDKEEDNESENEATDDENKNK